MDLQQLKNVGEAPEWMTLESFATLSADYLLPEETPRLLYKRLAEASAKQLKKPELAAKFFNYMWKNWICPASPVLSNMGTNRGLPISCFASTAPDSMSGIMDSLKETAMLTKSGGGMGKYWGKLRPKGTRISTGGVTDGILSFLKMEEAVLEGVSQSGIRRGSGAQYYPITGSEAREFIDIRRNDGADLNKKCMSVNFHHALTVSDEFYESCKTSAKSRELWKKMLTVRYETGEPYVIRPDVANRMAPECYKKNNLTITTSNLCSEIFLYTDEEHTFVCCLSSLNLARYDEWKDSDVVQTAIWFLDGVMEEFIKRADGIPGLENSVRFAKKSRALGLGVLGWHTLLQSKMIPFESFEAMQLNAEVFKLIDEKSQEATKALALEYGEPEWCKGFGIRNSHRLAVAPTFSNALISGGVSQGIEPITANIFAQKTAKGAFVIKNKQLVELLKSKGKDTPEIWSEINGRAGSVAGLSFLSAEEKSVFATAREISQFTLVQQAAQRQPYIDQGQSLNLFFAAPEVITDTETKEKIAKYIHDVHRLAFELDIKGLYYLKGSAVMQGDKVFREEGECLSCSG
jgi:ribonucleoside-diphosphate reductase alpha chain